ncbi:WD40 repeat [Fusarium albosuccineum]|uniref:Mitochondrial division protein 1 n=1 Tax=Fusarium albosuccineum TaxID=1237068 RepID=A0A8H4NWR8_9HYPO|nr:WD40 repeat [Fusarium albosuccineum]
MTAVFSHDGRVLASASYDGTIRLWDVSEGREIKRFPYHDGMITAVAFSRDDLLLASASSQGTVRIWDLNSIGESKFEETRILGSVEFLSLSRDGERVASAGSDDATIGVWDLDTGQRTTSLVGHDDDLRGVFFVPGRDDTVISVSREKNVLFHDSISGDTKLALDCSPETYLDLKDASLSPNGTTLGLLYPATIELWDMFSGQRRYKLERDATTAEFTLMAFSVSNKLLGSGTEDGEVILWDLDTGDRKWIAHLDTEPWVIAMAFSYDDSTLVTAGHTNIFLLDVKTGACLARFKTEVTFRDIVFGSRSRHLLTDKGELTIPALETPGNDFHELKGDLSWEGYGLSDNGAWITWRSRNLLWLPPGYRPKSSLFRGLMVIIGGMTGRVVVLKFTEMPPGFDEDWLTTSSALTEGSDYC